MIMYWAEDSGPNDGYQDWVQELQRSKTSGTDFLDFLLLLVYIVLLVNAKLIRINHDQQMIDELIVVDNF